MDISALITKTIADSPPDEPRRYIGASSIGRKCLRSIWYGFMGEEGEPHPPKTKISFAIGKRLEGLLLDYMEQAGLSIIRPCKENKFLLYQDKEIPLFRGHADALMLPKDEGAVVVEIKTAKSSSFAQFKGRGLRIWQEAYFAQLQAYMGMSGYKRGLMLAVNKDASELHHEWVDYDDIYYHELRAKASVISKCTEPPERINKSPLFIVCSMCNYKRICHANRD